MNIALWIVQGLLAALFLFGGFAKLTMPLDEIVAQSGMPGLFIQFIAVAELFGAVGLILPMLLRIRPALTPLAAIGLAIITGGATVIGLISPDPVTALFPLLPCLLAAFVAYGRRHLLVGGPSHTRDRELLRAA